MSQNLALLLGHLGADAKVSVHGESTKFVVRLATTRKWRDGKGNTQEATQWHRVAYWTRGPHVVAFMRERLVTGALVRVEGSIEYPEIDGSEGKTRLTEIVASVLEVLPQAAPRANPAETSAKAETITPPAAVTRWSHADRAPIDEPVPAPQDQPQIV